MPRFLFTYLLYINVSLSFAQTYNVAGVVLDASTTERLYKVSVRVTKNYKGTATDSLGRFSLQAIKAGSQIDFSSIGYLKESVVITKDTFLVIKLEQTNTKLGEVFIKAPENPAWEILRKVKKQKKANDPKEYLHYQGSFYSKSQFIIDNITVVKDSLKKAETYSGGLMLLENVGKFYKNKDETKQVIEHSIQNLPKFIPINLLVIPDLNPLGFYLPYINFGINSNSGGSLSGSTSLPQRLFLNPLEDHNFKLYDFTIEDTVLQAGSVSYQIDFRPLEGYSFDALEGKLWIDTLDFAITKISAKSADAFQITKFQLNQSYQKIDGRWFPTDRQVEANFTVSDKTKSMGIKFSNQIRSKDILWEAPPKEVIFDGVEKLVLPYADTLSKSAFDSLRYYPLDSIEKKIYKDYEFNRLPQLKKLLDFSDFYIKSLMSGVFDLNYVLLSPFNFSILGIRGFSVGGRIQNNYLKNPRFGVSTALNYNATHKFFGYENLLNWFITKNRFNTLGFFHTRGMNFTGKVDYLRPNYALPYRSSLPLTLDSSGIDLVANYGLVLNLKIAKDFLMRVRGFEENRKGLFFNLPDVEGNNLQLRHLEWGIRYARKETFVRNGFIENVLNAYFPIINFLVRKSASTSSAPENFNFISTNLKITHQIRSKSWGQTNIVLNAGKVWGTVPYAYLFNNLSAGSPLGIFSNDLGALNSEKRSNQAFNEFAYLGVYHNFGKNLFRTRLKYSQPEIIVGHVFAYRNLSEQFLIQGLDLKPKNNYQPELSFSVNNLLRLKVRGIYLGFGASVFYAYRSTSPQNYRITPLFTFPFL